MNEIVALIKKSTAPDIMATEKEAQIIHTNSQLSMGLYRQYYLLRK